MMMKKKKKTICSAGRVLHFLQMGMFSIVNPGQGKSEFNSHLALAMLGVPEFEEDYEHLVCR